METDRDTLQTYRARNDYHKWHYGNCLVTWEKINLNLDHIIFKSFVIYRQFWVYSDDFANMFL